MPIIVSSVLVVADWVFSTVLPEAQWKTKPLGATSSGEVVELAPPTDDEVATVLAQARGFRGWKAREPSTESRLTRPIHLPVNP
ncbi:MAG: hypothetical protein Q8S33_02130 [Myxococcales bacterium]|nr:hypothetical protein [Myxococcales bacterium]